MKRHIRGNKFLDDLYDVADEEGAETLASVAHTGQIADIIEAYLRYLVGEARWEDVAFTFIDQYQLAVDLQNMKSNANEWEKWRHVIESLEILVEEV